MKATIVLESETEFKKFIGGRYTGSTQEEEQPEDKEVTEDEAERYSVASDLATVCDYLEDSEVIKIRLIVEKCKARKEKAENE